MKINGKAIVVFGFLAVTAFVFGYQEMQQHDAQDQADDPAEAMLDPQPVEMILPADTRLRNGVGVKGAAYKKWVRRWKSEGRGLDATTFLTAHLTEIQADAIGAQRCPECGAERGIHAAYCSRRGTR